MNDTKKINQPHALRRRLERKYIRKLLLKRPKANPKSLDLVI